MENKIKYLHIMSNEKFTASYIKFINSNFKRKEHFFLIIDGISENKIKVLKGNNILRYKTLKFNNFFWKKMMLFYRVIITLKILNNYCENSRNIYFHGFFDKKSILFLYIFRKYLKISNWIVWGGDLYCYEKRKNNLIYKLWYKIEGYVKGNMSGYITHIEGDYKLAQNWYGARGKYFDCFMYLSNLYKELEIKSKSNDELCIQVGNSADPSNNHLEILDKLTPYKDDNIKIYCILSYGDKKWSKKVESYGIKKFGKKFIPVVDFMKFEEYMKFLSGIDIAIFAHNRQQAVGNITSLLSMEKTVYLKECVTTWKTFENLGVELKSFDKFNDLKKLDNNILEKNKEIIKSRFSEERLIKDWSEIFYD